MENGGFLLAAFGIVWIVVFGYLLVLSGRQRKLTREMESLKSSMKEKGTS